MVSHLAKLKEKKYRDSEQSFIIEGDHLLNEALKEGLVEEIITTDMSFFSNDISCYEVSDNIMKKISNQVSPSKVVAICKKVNPKEIKGNVCLLDNIQDPGNLGAIIRSAVAFNIDTIIMSEDTVDLYNEKVYEANRKSRFLSGLMMPLMNFIGDFGYVAVCIVGALLALNGKISFGVIVAFITYVRLFTSPLAQIAQAMTSLQQTAAASERVFEFKDAEEMENENKLTKSLNKKDVKGEIEFQNVVFKYDGNESPTIKDFSALAKPGKKIAIVGPTGAGKTTLVNLLMKFYKINGGDIKIDGVSINDLKRENVHELFTMVLQDTWLFNGTIKENIIYNRENVSFEEIEKVCKTVGLDHFIKTLPGAYDYEITDNDSISAGQKQLLTIARGMMQDTPFLILDEATSNVDTRTEELVQKAMDKLTVGKTSFIIAHRLSTIKNADMILVINNGDIVEQGNHEELLAKDGFYATLYNSQFDEEEE